MTSNAAEVVVAFNAGREEERLSEKYSSMRRDPFRFLRGTCHLFHQRMSEQGLSLEGPRAWICGDLHLENVGTYLGDNGLVYFDVSDFDEATLAPFSWDILRLATSVLVGGPVIGVKPAEAKAHAGAMVDTYFSELAGGKPRWLERRTATGPVRELIDDLKLRDWAKFLDKRTTVSPDGRRSIDVDPKKKQALPASAQDRKALRAFVADFSSRVPGHGPMELVDAARRIAGTGSLGIARFVLLVEGPDGFDLLDLKASAPPALLPYAPGVPPAFESEAHRVTAIQRLFQANTPSLLSAQSFRDKPFVLKQLQPTADRLKLKALAKDGGLFAQALADMARLAAWGHFRGTGRYGSATADDLIAAASGGERGRTDVMDAASALAQINADDWAAYCAAYDKGAFGKPIQGSVDD